MFDDEVNFEILSGKIGEIEMKKIIPEYFLQMIPGFLLEFDDSNRLTDTRELQIKGGWTS